MLLIAIVVVLLLVVLNGLFAMTELAVVSSRRSKLQARADTWYLSIGSMSTRPNSCAHLAATL